MELDLPTPYVARPYRGAIDHPTMASVLADYHEVTGDPMLPTAEQFDVTYANLTNCDPATDIAVIETVDGEPVGYVRSSWEQLEDGTRDLVVFSPMRAAHLAAELYLAVLSGVEVHMRPWVASWGEAWNEPSANVRFKAGAVHPGPGLAATGEAAWLESAGYHPIRFGAWLVRHHLDDIPERSLPDGVELRPVTDDQLRTIFDADCEAFRGSWDFHEPTEQDWHQFHDNPTRDTSLWKIAWAGDTVVGQVKSFVNHEENEQRGYLRGYTEEISTHAEWRNRGIAGALLAMSLVELRERGYQEAALGVDTDNPGGAFQLYTGLGFELSVYDVVYAKPL